MISVLLILGITRWLRSSGQPARLIRKPPERKAKVTLAEPRSAEAPDATSPCSLRSSTPVSPSGSQKETL